MPQYPPAQEITLTLVKPLAPPFHRHIARSKLLGKACQKGDRVVVYEITATDPEGLVVVTEQSLLKFQ